MNDALHVRVKRLFRGRVDVRSTTAYKAIMQERPLIIHFNDESMTLTPDELKLQVKDVSRPMRSKFNNKQYTLFSYDWSANDEKQLKLIL